MTAILSTVLGLVLVFLVFAIVVSGLQEWWAQFRGHRGRFLLKGLTRLVEDESVLDRLLQHPLVGALYREGAATGKPPSYIDPKSFALALTDVIARREAAAQERSTTANVAEQQVSQRPLDGSTLRLALEGLRAQRSPLANALLPIVDKAGSDLSASLDGIAAWFSSGMDRVSGWYKGFAQRRLFAIGLLVALLGNVDAIAIFSTLNRSLDLQDALRAEAERVVRTGTVGGIAIGDFEKRGPMEAERAAALAIVERVRALDKDAALPIGYACLSLGKYTHANASAGLGSRCWNEVKSQWADPPFLDALTKSLGLLLTALAGVLGAPFWFAAMSKIVNLRGSGPRPAAAQG